MSSRIASQLSLPSAPVATPARSRFRSRSKTAYRSRSDFASCNWLLISSNKRSVHSVQSGCSTAGAGSGDRSAHSFSSRSIWCCDDRFDAAGISFLTIVEVIGREVVGVFDCGAARAAPKVLSESTTKLSAGPGVWGVVVQDGIEVGPGGGTGVRRPIPEGEEITGPTLGFRAPRVEWIVWGRRGGVVEEVLPPAREWDSEFSCW